MITRAIMPILMVKNEEYVIRAVLNAALEASGCEIVTVAIRRLDLDNPSRRTLLDDLDVGRYFILPNTATM